MVADGGTSSLEKKKIPRTNCSKTRSVDPLEVIGS